MKRNTLHISLLLLFSFFFYTPDAWAQQEKLPANPEARQQFLEALKHLQKQLPAIPAAQESLSATKYAAKYAADDSTETGGITGHIEGVTPDDSTAWVLVVAAHLHEDPTAWAFGEVKPEGDYVVTGLKMGSYFVMAGADGYFPQFFSHAYSIWEAIVVEVTPQEITQSIDFFLEPLNIGEGGISGLVVEEVTQEPVSQAQIFAFNINNPFISAWTYTNDDGTYELNNLRNGQYYVQAFGEGFFIQYYDGAELYEDATPVIVSSDQVIPDINFQLNRGGTISGTATDSEGNPIEGASVQAYADNERGIDIGGVYGWGITDENGNYTISGLYSGEYIVSLHHYTHYYSVTEWYDDATTEEEATPVEVQLGEDASGIDFQIDAPSEFGSLAGNIATEDGTPTQSALLRLESIDLPNFYFHTYVFPDDNGDYVFEKVPVGTYRVVLEYWTNWFYDIMWYEQAASPADATPVSVETDQQTSGIDFIIPVANGVLTGMVTNVDGKPIANAYIQINNPFRGGPFEEGAYIWAHGNTDKDGNYRIEGLPDGEYFVSAFFCYFWECSQQWWPGVEYEERAEPVYITDGQSEPATVDFELPIELGDGSISGNVQNTNGGILPGALVSISPYYNISDITPGYPWVSEMHTYADSLGNYSFNFLPEGTFMLYSSYWEDGASGFEWYEDAEDVANATPIDLGENQVVTDINFTLDVRSYFGSIVGTVLLEDGTPVERAFLEVNSYYQDYDDPTFFPSEWYGITDADGSFQIDGLYEGEYMMSVHAQSAMSVPSDSSGAGSLHVKVTGGEVTVVEFNLIEQNDGPAEIAGTISAEQGDVIEIGIVKATPVTDDGAAYYTAVSDENGAYRLTGLPEGAYYVQARAPWHITEYYDNTSDPAEAELVDTAENLPAEGIDFSLEPFYFFFDFAREDGATTSGPDIQTSFIYGTVRNENGNVLAGATVYVVDEAGDPLISTETFDDGMYELAGIQPGASYRIKATHAGYESRYNGAETDVESAPAMVMNSGRYEVNFELVKSSTSVSKEKERELPGDLKLFGNYPNPFSTETRIGFSIPEAAHVLVEIYDALGRKVDVVHEGILRAGAHNLRWSKSSSSTSPSGLYFYRVTAGQESSSGSMTILR